MKIRVCLGTIAVTAGAAGAQITNGSFETGDFAGWLTQDMGSPFFPLSVNAANTVDTFGWGWSNTPTDGQFDALTGFDGDGASGPVSTVIVAQDALINASTLEFDYRAAWDLTFGGTIDRTFNVEIEPAGGGGALQVFNILTAVQGTTMTDTGPLSASLDVSAYVGQNVRVSFEWEISEDFVGPGQATLDNIRLTPAPASLALLGLGGLVATRRRR